MKPYGFVYITTNTVSGMLYIGQTHYSCRMRSDYFGSGKAITRAIRKYGKSAFKREIIFEAFTKDDLDWAETFFIAEHDAVKSRKYYNISPGGRASLGFTGKKHSPERNKSLSEKMKASHPRAIEVCIDGVVYHGFGAACRTTGFSGRKLQKFLDTGVHPNDQIHGGRGISKKSPTTKIWKLLKEDDSSIITVEGLKPWCRQNGINHHQLCMTRKRKTFFCGFQLIDHID